MVFSFLGLFIRFPRFFLPTLKSLNLEYQTNKKSLTLMSAQQLRPKISHYLLRVYYVLGTLPSTVQTTFYLILMGLCEGRGLINSILYLKKPMNRETKYTVQGHLAKNWQSQDSDSGLFNAKPYMLNLKISSSQSVVHGCLRFPGSFIGPKPCS